MPGLDCRAIYRKNDGSDAATAQPGQIGFTAAILDCEVTALVKDEPRRPLIE